MNNKKINKIATLMTIILIFTGCSSYKATQMDSKKRSDDIHKDKQYITQYSTSSTYSQQINENTVVENESSIKNDISNQMLEKVRDETKKVTLTFDEEINGESSKRMIDNFDINGENNNAEEYKHYIENEYKQVANNPLSTFSIDVDTASYSNLRRNLMNGQMPPNDSIRIEEMINYFSYNYKEPKGKVPFSINTEISTCPWNEEHYLAMIGIQGENINLDEAKPSNLVFLLDVSGSMNNSDKLPLLKSGFKLLVNELDEDDKVSIVVYAGASGMILEGVGGQNKEQILEALNSLKAGGSTAGGEGIELAYRIAKENYIKNGNNRVILATDGDFNVGLSSESELEQLIIEKRKSDIFLSILGFGTGNIKDNKMEILADKGNGNYSYIDSIMEAKKVLVNEIGGTLYTIAKDVKIQVEFNPIKVKEYRLIGYDNRILNNRDFDDDTKDAGELGAGNTVTAFYEIIPYGSEESISNNNNLKYQKVEVQHKEEFSDEWMEIRLRYKEPNENLSKKIIKIITKDDVTYNTTADFKFASAVAEFGLILKDSKYRGDSSYRSVIELAKKSKGVDDNGYRTQFIQLVELAEKLKE